MVSMSVITCPHCGHAAIERMPSTPFSASGALFGEAIPARTGTDWANRNSPRPGQPSIVAKLHNGTAGYRRHRYLYRGTTHRFALQRVFQRRRWPR